jgi:hypothetical protein
VWGGGWEWERVCKHALHLVCVGEAGADQRPQHMVCEPFIDFGIVGRISPVTWTAMQALPGSLAVGDYDTMARALATIGACNLLAR